MPAMRVLVLAAALAAALPALAQQVQVYQLPEGAYPHDVAPAPDGKVWYAAQRNGALGILDPATGKAREVKLGSKSAPHGVIQGPDGAAWLTDGGQNAIVRVDAKTEEVRAYKLPEDTGYTNLNTAAFDKDGIAATPDGDVYYASLAGSHIARIDRATGEAELIEPPTKGQGARRVWSDSQGRIWVSEWNSGQLSVYDPKTKAWKAWKLPGDKPRAYAVYVDERDVVWVSDWGNHTVVSFDPKTEAFKSYPNSAKDANVRQILGRPGEVWFPESGTDRLMVIRTAAGQ